MLVVMLMCGLSQEPMIGKVGKSRFFLLFLLWAGSWLS